MRIFRCAKISNSLRASTACRTRPPRRQSDDRAAWPAGPRGATRGQTLGRLEAAARARRLHAAPIRNCFCSTSRPPASIPRRGAISGARFTSSPPTASPCSSPPITWTKPSAATRSPISPSAKSWPAARSSDVIAQLASDDLHRQHDRRRKSLRARRRAQSDVPASTWWRRSAPACMSPAATARRWKRRSRLIAVGPGLDWERAVAVARRRVHRPDGPDPGGCQRRRAQRRSAQRRSAQRRSA